jgi:hypothetical protein
VSEVERQSVLRFSLGGTAFQIACGLLMVAACALLVFEFGFRFEEVAQQSARHQFFWEILRSNGGATGAILFALSGLFFVWHTFVASRRFTAGKAAVLTERGLALHPSYSRDGIPYGDILSADMRSHGYFVHSLYIRIANRRRIRLQSTAIEGGKEALEAFAAELEARRTFEGHGGS